MKIYRGKRGKKLKEEITLGWPVVFKTGKKGAIAQAGLIQIDTRT